MKGVRWLLIACLVVVLALGAVGCVQRGSQAPISVTTQQNTGIWVTGQGETMVVPDVSVERKAIIIMHSASGAPLGIGSVLQLPLTMCFIFDAEVDHPIA